MSTKAADTSTQALSPADWAAAVADSIFARRPSREVLAFWAGVLIAKSAIVEIAEK